MKLIQNPVELISLQAYILQTQVQAIVSTLPVNYICDISSTLMAVVDNNIHVEFEVTQHLLLQLVQLSEEWCQCDLQIINNIRLKQLILQRFFSIRCLHYIRFNFFNGFLTIEVNLFVFCSCYMKQKNVVVCV